MTIIDAPGMRGESMMEPARIKDLIDRAQDNPGNRRRKIRTMLFKAFGMEEGNDIFTATGVPMLRLPGLPSAAKRVLNIDQSAILSIDEAAGTVELKRDLLVQQFELGGRQ